MIIITTSIVLFALMMYSVRRTDHLDVSTERRDSLDYGSDHGWYWPWTPIIQLCFVGIMLCVIASL